MKRPRTIAVDLVPMLPGGDNGGAKIFVLELLRALRQFAPQTRFILLTRKSSHHELDALLGPTMTRRMVWDDQINPSSTSFRIGAGLLRRIPARLRRFVPSGLFRILERLIGRSDTALVFAQVGADLLYCPFGGTVFGDWPIPMAVTVYDLQYQSYPEFFAADDYAVRDRNFRQACAMSAMAVISDYVRGSVIARNLADPDRVRTIHIKLPKRLLVVDATRKDEVLRKFSLSERKYFIYPANFWPHKNHKNLVAAFAGALRSGLPAGTKLVLTGAPSPRTQEVLDAAKALGAGDQVVALGFIDETELAALVMSSLAMINPSLYEGFGMPVLEAMALDCPVACSNITSLPEVAGDAALLFDPNNQDEIAASMVRLATEPGLREDLIARGRRRAERFADTAEMARQYCDLFELASDGSVFIPSVSGIYADGWAGPQIILRYPAGHSERTAHIEMQLPDGAPYSPVILELRGPDGLLIDRHSIERGPNRSLEIPVGAATGSITISVRPHFSPAHISGAGDTRNLSIVVRKLELREPNNAIVIFPSPA